MQRRVVDFPAPFGPRKPVTRPGATSNVRSSTASVEPKRFVRPRTSIIWSTVPPQAEAAGGGSPRLG